MAQTSSGSGAAATARAQGGAATEAVGGGGVVEGSAGGSAGSGASGGERKRVKVYELKNNDWYDRGTGFCTGQLLSATPTNDSIDARIIVISEEDPSRTLLESYITKEDGYQKQQETLIVWTELNGVDMALSFQEADGCAAIWTFVSEIQNRIAAIAPDDTLSDDLLDSTNPIVLPEPSIERLDEIEATIRAAASTPAGRDALAKFVMHPEHLYIMKLAPLVQVAESLESVENLHKLCTIMKHLILINDTSIIEFVVTDQAIMGVVGALEYDPDFPSHRANHRQYLSDSSKFKEVVPITDLEIRQKIHWTYRLLYLKDVVLARILDDPTFSVLNSLIFFHQVDIVNHLQSNQEFLQELFEIFRPEQRDPGRKKEAVLFIQNCCAVSKNIQAQNRAQLYQHFIGHGLFAVITFALRHQDASVRVAGTDILVALIDHDPHMVRNHIFSAIRDSQVPLTDTLIELLLVEVDLGVKSQMADAIKILLDPISGTAGLEMMNRNAELQAKQRAAGGQGPVAVHIQAHQSPQTLQFIESFYEGSAKRLFAPLAALETRPTMCNLTVQETSLFTHLVEILCFFVRQHHHRSKGFILGEHLHCRIAQLLSCPQKHMKLAALKWFRTCVALQDEFHNRQLIQYDLLQPVIEIVEQTMPRDNLLNSACLELFEYIKREGLQQLIAHLVESYRERLLAISYVNTFQGLVVKYEQIKNGPPVHPEGAEDSFSTQEGTPQRLMDGRQAFSGLKEMDTNEQAYFDGDDDVDDDEELPTFTHHARMNGASAAQPLVDYPDDDDEENDRVELMASSPDQYRSKKPEPVTSTLSKSKPIDEAIEADNGPSPLVRSQAGIRISTPLEGSPNQRQSPPESIAMKRRRMEDEDDDELGKMMGGVKRRNSTHSNSGNKSVSPQSAAANSEANCTFNANHQQGSTDDQPPSTHVLRRKGSLKPRNESHTAVASGKIAVNIISADVITDKQNSKDSREGKPPNPTAVNTSPIVKGNG